MISDVVIAVPARNEQVDLVACLTSIDEAASMIGVPCTIVLAADSCTDLTATVAWGAPLSSARLIVVEGEWGRAGAARGAAVRSTLADIGDATAMWIANTDADCVVPRDWLLRQLCFADEYRAVAGIVELDHRTTEAGLLDRFVNTYVLDGDSHSHVHGANLGIRADAYLAVGGWCPQTVVGEDHGLWDRTRDAGLPSIQTTAVRVTTSARIHSRVEGGFATDLLRLSIGAAQTVAVS